MYINGTSEGPALWRMAVNFSNCATRLTDKIETYILKFISGISHKV